jgi:hypothetical protein
MVDAVQTFGDLANWHSHIHAIVAEAKRRSVAKKLVDNADAVLLGKR